MNAPWPLPPAISTESSQLMPRVTYIDIDGSARTVEAQAGMSVMEAAVKADIPGIVAECGGACSCATCHVYVDQEWVARAGPPSVTEAAMLEFAADPRPNSRLACQIALRDELDGLTVRTPAQQG